MIHKVRMENIIVISEISEEFVTTSVYSMKNGEILDTIKIYGCADTYRKEQDEKLANMYQKKI